MRTSNKILLTTFLVMLLVPTAIHFSLYAKLKNGDFTDSKEKTEERFTHHVLKNKNYVSARGLGNLQIITSDSLALDIEKWEKNNVTFSEQGDSLLINTGNASATGGNDGSSRNDQQVILYIPSVQGIVLEDCYSTVVGAGQQENAPSVDLQVSRSEVYIGARFSPKGSRNYFGRLNVRTIDNSVVILSPEAFAQELNLTLFGNSELRDEGITLNKLTGMFGDSTLVVFKGQNLSKLNK